MLPTMHNLHYTVYEHYIYIISPLQTTLRSFDMVGVKYEQVLKSAKFKSKYRRYR